MIISLKRNISRASNTCTCILFASNFVLVLDMIQNQTFWVTAIFCDMGIKRLCWNSHRSRLPSYEKNMLSFRWDKCTDIRKHWRHLFKYLLKLYYLRQFANFSSTEKIKLLTIEAMIRRNMTKVDVLWLWTYVQSVAT